MPSEAQMKMLSAILLLSAAFRAATATDHLVGDEVGWTVPSTANGLDYKVWANTTNFVVGDTLVFNYDPSLHTVLSVTGPAFAACDTSAPLEGWTDGNTKVTLEKAGRMWFICGVPNHCSLGQGFKLTVSDAPAAGPDSPPAGPDLDSSASAAQSGAGNASMKGSKAMVILFSIMAGIFL